MSSYITLTPSNLASEHLCCAISGKEHKAGVKAKKMWLGKRLSEGHVFRKLDEKAKVFIEYSPLETAWVPIVGDNYIYIYCLWVSGKYKGRGHAKDLLQYCIEDAKKSGKSGICIISSKKKQPFVSDKKFMEKQGFKVADQLEYGYELLALSFDGTMPRFSESARKQSIESKELTIYYGLQCPYIPHCIEQVQNFCRENNIPLTLVAVDSLEKSKNLPCVFNNWAVFLNGNFATLHLLNEGFLKKLLKIN